VVTTLPPTSDISQPPAHTGDTVVAPPGDAVPIPGMTAQTKPAPLPPPQPAPTYSPDAYNKFTELNNRYQAELQKPVGTRQLDGLIADYKSLGAQKDLPASVKQGTEVRIAALEKLATIQRLQKENAVSVDALDAQRKALHEEYGAAEKAIEDYQNSGPYLAQGKLQTSTAVAGKYALVNPATGRTVAYVDPASPIDIGKLLGEYIGVRGTTATAPGTEVTVIKVSNATLLPAPATAKEK
jgi:hypothetical protein